MRPASRRRGRSSNRSLPTCRRSRRRTCGQDAVDGAVWRDPERVEDWVDTLSKDEPVVTFCVYGFHIGCQTAAALRKAGFDARYMAGGYYGWKALKGPMKLAG
jgi:Fe-Mn family superoxide dismutase